jgi:hypothetical protein
MTGVRAAVLAACLAAGAAAEARAQGASVRRPPRGPARIELAAGGMWAPGFDVGSRTAELTRGSGSDPFDLFTSEGDVNGFPGVHARIGFYVTPALSIEGGVRYAKPQLSYQLSGDAESAPEEVAVEKLSHYVVDGSLSYHFLAASFAQGRGVPFASGGGGYVRELHEGNQLVETGTEIHATLGVHYWFGTGRRRAGLRAEGGISARDGGFDPREGRRMQPIVLAGAAFLF